MTWPILGPYSLVKLSKLADGLDPVAVARSAGDALWAWVRDAAADPASGSSSTSRASAWS